MSNEQNPGPGPNTSFKLYGLLICFALNSALLLFTLVKLLCKGKNDSASQNGQNRKAVFSLVSLALFCRGLYEGYKIHASISVPQPPRSFNILTVLDNLPTILLITLASSFSSYWHKRYTSFEGQEIGQKKNSRYRCFLIFLNLIFCLVFAGLMWRILHNPSEKMATILMSFVYGTFSLDLFIITVALWITGKQLFNRTTRFINYTGRTIKSSSGFKCNFYLLIFCCLIKCTQQSIFCFSQWNYKIPFYLSNDIFYYNLFITMFYIMGETGVFFCLIVLLDIRATKCEALLDQDDKSGKLLVSSTSELDIGSKTNTSTYVVSSTHL